MKRLLPLALALSAFTLGSCSQFTLSQNGTNPPVALVYGVSEYFPGYYYPDPYSPPDTRSPNLVAARADAVSLAKLLGDRGWQATQRLDGQASVATLEADVATVAATAAPGQRVLFYWSGHGLPGVDAAGQPTGYLAMYGLIKPVAGSSYLWNYDYAHSVSPSRLASIFKPLLDKGVCLIAILDSCYSGGFASTQTYGSGLPDNYGTYHNPNIHSDTRLTETAQSAFAQSLALYFGRAASANAMANAQTWVLSAAGADEESWETATYGHGVFTYFLLQAGTAASGGLLRGDANLDGHLSLQEAQRYCLAAIEKNWNEAQPSSDLLTWDLQFKPHLSGNPLDILLF